MNTKQSFTIVIMALATIAAYGQSATNFTAGNIKVGGIYDLKKDLNEDADGSPYFSDTWNTGSITILNKGTYAFDSIRFDVYSNELIYVKKGIFFTLPKDVVIENFKIGNATFINELIKKWSDPDFYELIYKDSLTLLLKKYKCTFREGTVSNGLTPEVKSKFTLNSNYFIKNNDTQEIKKITKRSDLIEMMNDKQNEIKMFLKSQKINPKREGDLIKVLNYYNSL